MIPKIEFRYSDVYDRGYRESTDIHKYLEKKGQEYPSKKEIKHYIKKVEKLWEKDKKKILKEISKTSGLNWKEKRIICYIIGVGRPFSEPLTIRTYGKNTKRFIETLIHEMIHQIQIQNNDKYTKWQKYVFKKYPKEERTTKTHIFLDAIHWKILEKLFRKNGLEKEIKKYEKHKDYQRAWKIVKEEGADNIIKKFKEVTK